MVTVRGVEARAFSFPPNKRGQVAVVVSTKQGQNPVGREDSALVPVGTGVLQEGGSPSLSNISSPSGKPSIPFDSQEAYRVRVLTLADISGSMGEASGVPSETKLGHVQNRVKDFSGGLSDQGITDVEHVLIPYDTEADVSARTRDTAELQREICLLNPRGGTDFCVALQAVIDEIKRDLNNQARNLVILISDGQHNDPRTRNEVIELAKRLPDLDCGIYLVGVGPGYDEDLMKQILTGVGFGGLTHIPLPGNLNVFKTILPPFIAQVRTAPNFPIVSFDENYLNVVNLTPSVREIVKQDFDRSLHQLFGKSKNYPAVAGYQLNGYSVGFTTEVDVCNGGVPVFLIVKSEGNCKNNLGFEEISIEPFDGAILDPSERTLIERAPIDAILAPALGKRDPDLLEKLLQDFGDKLDPNQRKLLEEQIVSLRNPNRSQEDEAGTRGSYTQLASDFANVSLTGGGRKNTGRLETIVDIGTDTGSKADEEKPAGPNLGKAQEIGGTEVNLTPPLEINFEIIKGNGTLEIKPELLKEGSLVSLHDSDEVKLGKNENCDIKVVGDRKVSRQHCSIRNDGGKLILRDLNSTNGTFLNNKRITQEEVKNKDLIRVGNTVVKISIS